MELGQILPSEAFNSDILNLDLAEIQNSAQPIFKFATDKTSLKADREAWGEGGWGGTIYIKITNAKNRNNLIEYTRTLDRILRTGSWMIPLFHDPYHRIAHQEYISIPKKIPLYGFNAWTAWKK